MFLRFCGGLYCGSMARHCRVDRALPALALAAALAAAAGCSGSSSSTTPPASSGATGSVSSKPILKGLVTQGPATTAAPPTNQFEELYAHPGIYSAAVIQLYWSQLEPTQGGFDDNPLTAALAILAQYNASYPATPVVGKLRIFMGVGTPAWVATATGPVTVASSSGQPMTIGEFWTPTYQALWQQLQQHLASEFDGSAAIGEVAITSCSSLTGEPFVLPHTQTDIAALQAAGYTDAQGKACLTSAPQDYAAWKITPLDYTFNSFTEIATGQPVADTSFPVQEMAAFRAALGTRGVVANHGLQPQLTLDQTPIYAEFQTLASEASMMGTVSPLEFQTISPTVDWADAIALGLTYKPTELEIWDTVTAGGQAVISTQQLTTWAADLK